MADLPGRVSVRWLRWGQCAQAWLEVRWWSCVYERDKDGAEILLRDHGGPVGHGGVVGLL